MFIYHFLISNVLISFTILIIFLIKSLFGKRLSAKYNYLMWFFVILLMFAAFLPNMGIPVFTDNNIKNIIFNNNSGSNLIVNSEFKDLYVSVKRYNILYFIWLSGFMINLLILVLGRIKLEKIVKNKEESLLFENCCERIGVKADLYISPYVNSPLSYGIIKPVVVMPVIKLNDSQIEHIIFHELIHHKHKDTFVGYIICLLGALYWFNPLMYIMFRRIKLDMEIYCDYSVIGYTRDNIDYGNTIISMAEEKVRMKMANYFSDSKDNLIIRITRISDFYKKSSVMTGRVVFALLAIVTLMFSFVINSYGYSVGDSSYGVEADYINLDTYFNDYEGCFVLYDTYKERYKIYNMDMARKRVSPNSTYKIALALNGLEEGVITAENNEIKWDGTENPFKEWNKNHNLNSAMKYSVNWYFQNIDSKIGKGKISDYLNKISYGNMQTGFDSKNYWLENSLKISPVEQVEFLRRLYSNEFDFDAENVKTVLNSIRISDNFYGKTGTGMINGKTVNGWFVGIIDQEDNTYIFAARISAKDNATGLAAEKITENILEDILMIN